MTESRPDQKQTDGDGRRVSSAIFASLALLWSGGAATAENFAPAPVPPEVRTEFQLAPFYQKYVSAGGLPVVGSAKVNDAALAECAWLVTRMLQRRPDILKALAEGNVRFAIMAHDEYTTDIPEHAHLLGSAGARAGRNAQGAGSQRGRGKPARVPRRSISA